MKVDIRNNLVSATALLVALSLSTFGPGIVSAAIPAAHIKAYPKRTLAAQKTPLSIRVVILTAFEIGEDQGDKAGEFQAWADILPDKLPFSAGPRNLRYNPKTGVLAVNTGIGTGQAATSVIALGLDPRFDFSHAYWLVAAIAGVNPNTGSVGSAAWIGDVIDSDFGYMVDPREIPSNWTTGWLPWDRQKPYQQPLPDTAHNLFPLNKKLQNWAYQLTQKTTLPDTLTLQKIRALYPRYKAALHPPEILKGDEATGQTFWHGAIANNHIEKWVAYWTGGKGIFVMSGMEDSGILRAISVLGTQGRADPNRVMILRTASNYTLPPLGENAVFSLVHEEDSLSAMQSALNAAFTVGNKVVNELSQHWEIYRDHIPQP
ncbi:purine-nucleoside phosphorylase [Zymomonas mobilis]|uniref:Purine nucleoside permease n=1 Tax=Zymomonas mobilis subsp. pomaceae (strain ATCC 29192 / DSM 22645 / JCM 10191 / CCUG 17912 / NBRC 13757 / NCIMB 11200 / NRRL B-4491 / Barker I) TaxID=579138 RepID=F8EUJ3_ZYMMT|nr:purine nucleoside permease [Zymomonas mobilis]AEI37209.1 purine nucleoside permease [Zymomonas mobilis subsp. pomaceae ATCC 29192]MDX5948579.1 purine nucleoside permease [Zymomonas mobilis subsp. pomaceae]GEB88385.1 NUP-family purine nucleoside permease [Zymomonas mobilis subsp. pomaceae]